LDHGIHPPGRWRLQRHLIPSADGWVRLLSGVRWALAAPVAVGVPRRVRRKLAGGNAMALGLPFEEPPGIRRLLIQEGSRVQVGEDGRTALLNSVHNPFFPSWGDRIACP
ncbi:MAG: hypothetical protein ACREOS_08460, partial [Candidatus Dormibacteraceae bacterium]